MRPAAVAKAKRLPLASNVNFVAGHTVANTVIAKVGTGGAVCVFVSAAVHLVVDVDGYFATGGSSPLDTTYATADIPGA